MSLGALGEILSEITTTKEQNADKNSCSTSFLTKLIGNVAFLQTENHDDFFMAVFYAT